MTGLGLNLIIHVVLYGKDSGTLSCIQGHFCGSSVLLEFLHQKNDPVQLKVFPGKRTGRSDTYCENGTM
ncbi:MAG: hypothetical protein MZV70_73400 [Desulfobacterales bacterium]|nr:hypothetical protein [Desulfobacterales bacterium]